MFGAKAKEIKNLKLGMMGLQGQIEEWIKANEALRAKITALTSQIDKTEANLYTSGDTLAKLQQDFFALCAERDQFAKRCEELEEKITRMLLDRQAAQEASKEPLAFESPNPNSNETPV